MTSTHRRIVSSVLACASLGTVALWFEHPFLVAALLALFGVGLMRTNWSPDLPRVYIGAFVGGPVAEIIAIHAGAWQYAEAQFLGIPVWLPFLWGNAALFIVRWRHRSLQV